jgi:protein phosphatase
MKDIKLFALTDIGMARFRNEDHYFFKVYEDTAVAVVADGMGGAAFGEVASRIVVETVEEVFEGKKDKDKPGPQQLIEECLRLSHRKIRKKAKNELGNPRMGTTCTLVAVNTVPAGGTGGKGSSPSPAKKASRQRKKTTVFFGHIGDSRLYHIRNDRVEQKTTDHTMMQKLLEAGALKPEDIETFAHKNVIYKSLGGSETVAIDPVQQFDIKKKDVLLLCSDGFSNYIRPEEMSRALRAVTNLEKSARYLVNLAKYRGGDDNITVILIEYGRYPRQKDIKLEDVPKMERYR